MKWSIVFLAALAIWALPTSAMAQPTGTILSVSSTGKLSGNGTAETITFGVTIECTEALTASIDGTVTQFSRRDHTLFANQLFGSIQDITCTGQPQDFTVAAANAFTFGPLHAGQAGVDVLVTVCDPGSSTCSEIDATGTIQLVRTP